MGQGEEMCGPLMGASGQKVGSSNGGEPLGPGAEEWGLLMGALLEAGAETWVH